MVKPGYSACILYSPMTFLKYISKNLFQGLFSHLDVLNYTELTLSANLEKKNLNRYWWNYGDKPQSRGEPLPDVFLRPMSIKTYLLYVKSRGC